MRYAQIRKTDIANGEGIRYLYMFKVVNDIVQTVLIPKLGILLAGINLI